MVLSSIERVCFWEREILYQQSLAFRRDLGLNFCVDYSIAGVHRFSAPSSLTHLVCLTTWLAFWSLTQWLVHVQSFDSGSLNCSSLTTALLFSRGLYWPMEFHYLSPFHCSGSFGNQTNLRSNVNSFSLIDLTVRHCLASRWRRWECLVQLRSQNFRLLEWHSTVCRLSCCSSWMSCIGWGAPYSIVFVPHIFVFCFYDRTCISSNFHLKKEGWGCVTFSYFPLV